MPVLQYEHEVSLPFDPATGAPTGKRQHLPVRVVHEVNDWSPLLLSAVVNIELFSSALVEFFEKGDEGRSREFYEVRLTHVRVSSLRKFMGDRGLMEEMRLTFQTIEETHTLSHHAGSDSGWPL